MATTITNISTTWGYQNCVWLDAVSWESSEVTVPTIEGDDGVEVTGSAGDGYVVKPSEGKTEVEVVLPSGVDASKVTVEVGPAVESVRLNGATLKIVRIVNGETCPITDYLNVPEAVEGVIDLTKAMVREEVVKDVLDTTKKDEPAVISLDPDSPSIRTARTKPGLIYSFSEGTTIEKLMKMEEKTGDGEAWEPEVSVKGGSSGFYSIGVRK